MANSQNVSSNFIINSVLHNEQQKELEQKYRGAAVEDLNLPIPVTVTPKVSCMEALNLMNESEFDNLPVVNEST